MLSVISPPNKKEEQSIQEEIYNSIDKNESIIFNSGAGAGKTYALIESLRYVLRNFGERLKDHNQKIICITYTNVATKEVKERLGNTDLVLVSTIHERIWEIIKNHQKQLVDIHLEKLKNEIETLEQNLLNGNEFIKYQELDASEKETFKKIMLENKKLFYQSYNAGAAEMRTCFQTLLRNFSDMLKNINNFKKIVSTIYRLNRYKECCEKIILKEQGYTSVEYNSMHNIEQFDKMRISHNTLLDYGLKIIERHDLLKRIIIDKYPYIFIDEYQDTDEKVVAMMYLIKGYANKINRELFIGYFGDSSQNIYDEGIGDRITEMNPALKPIDKNFNRRSTKEVIDVINKIRNDNIKQESIFDDSLGGSVEFFKGKPQDVQRFISKYINEWNVTLQNPLHCLVLTNKSVAEYSGFKNIYEVFKETDKYKGINYNQLNQELFSKDTSKLGEVPKILFNLLKLRNNIANKKSLVIDVSPKDSLFKEMSFKDLTNLISVLSKIEGETLKDYIESISTYYNHEENSYYKKIIDWNVGFENITSELFQTYLVEKLFENRSDQDIDDAKEAIRGFMEIKMSEFDLWYKFIIDRQEEKVLYHTYHGTKGREFENVIIIMENSFGRSRNYFNFFFENLNNNDMLRDEDRRKFQKIQNLLYVSCSRAIKNLRVLYIDNITSFESGIEYIFGTINSFE